MKPPTRKPIAQPVEDHSFNLPAGMVLWKVGDICPQHGAAYQCVRVNGSGAVFQHKNNKSDILHLSNCHDKNFSPANVRRK
jgi:hypothetical protein